MKENLKFIILSMIILFLTITPMTTVKAYEIGLSIDIDNTKADNTEANTYNATISKINHSNDLNIIMIQKDKNSCYSFITNDNTWSVGEKITITMDSNGMVTKAIPYVSKRDKYKLGENGIAYVKQLTTNADLAEYATKWLKDNYNMTLDIPVEFNSIKQDSHNDYIVYGQTFYDNSKPVRIAISSELNTIANDTNVITERMLIHELTHYVLATKKLPYEDGTEMFTTEALKNGANIDDKDNSEGILHSHVIVNQDLWMINL